MTTTAALVRCNRCRRVVRSEPLWMLGHPYGPTCGRRYGLVPERRPRVRAPDRTGVVEQPVLDGLDEDNESEEAT